MTGEHRNWRAYRFTCSDGVNTYRMMVTHVRTEDEARAQLAKDMAPWPSHTVVSVEEVLRLHPRDLGPR